MRLLNTESLRLEAFFGRPIPRYAILSHTWGDDEVLYEDMSDKAAAPFPKQKRGASKVLGSCREAQSQGYKYIWG